MIVYLQMIEDDGDKSKFEQIYRKYRGLMFHVARNILHNDRDAEDAVHQAFLAIIENLNKISDIHCPKTRSFLVIIVERKSIDILRKNNRMIPMERNDETQGMEIPLPGDNGLADALAKLPARYREVLLLRYDQGYSAKEIAKLFQMQPAAVQKLIWRAKQALQSILEVEGIVL